MTEKFNDFGEQGVFSAWMKYAIIFAVLFLIAAVAAVFVVERRGKNPQGRGERPASPEEEKAQHSSAATTEDLHNPVREAPATFPVDSNLPRGREVFASGPNDPTAFTTNQLVRFEDKRVWFDSDTKKNPEEDDHIIHRALEVPLKRLVNLLEKKGGGKAKLKVYDAYRPTGIHLENSLHREGRAIDLTAEGITLTELAKLAWQSGFDFVLYEKAGKGGGEHLHCSVRRSPDTPLPERPGGGASTPKTN